MNLTKSPVENSNLRIDFSAMGTEFFCILVGSDESVCESLFELANELESKWTRFDDASELMHLNNNPGEAISVSNATLRLVGEMKFGYELTQGLFDPNTLGDLIDLGFANSRKDPARKTTWSARAKNDASMAQVEIDLAAETVMIPAGIGIDAGGIGKGLAADLMATRAMEFGAKGVAVFAGGDVSLRGMSENADGWEVTVLDPRDSLQQLSTIRLSRGGLATSSSAAWVSENGNSHHIIDPRTHKSSKSDVLQATVIAQSAVHAEVLTKMCLILPSSEALSRMETSGAQALLVDHEHRVFKTSDWEQYV